MDLNKKKWLGILGSLSSAKNSKWITEQEYSTFKEKLKNWLDHQAPEEKHTDYSSYENCLSQDELSELIETSFDLTQKDLAKEINKLKRIDFACRRKKYVHSS